MKLEWLPPVRSALALLAELPGAVLVIEDGRVVEASDAAQELLGRHLHGLPVERLVPAPLVVDLGRQPQSHVLPLMRLDGSEFPAEIRLRRATIADRPLVLALLRDVSRDQAALRELEAARDAALQATQQKTQFLTLASHDLRQPVQALALLLDAMRARPESEIASLVERAQRSLDHMTELLNRLLELARLEAGQLRPAAVDVSIDVLLTTVRNEFLPAAQLKGLDVEMRPSGEWLSSDAGLLREILSNLLSNAIQYTARGGVVLAAQEGPDGALDVSVLDTGCGIPQDKLDAIFEDFRRLAASGPGRVDGFGLGLGIVRRLAEVLGLQVLVSSRPGVGSCFTLRVPADRRLERRPERVAGGAGASLRPVNPATALETFRDRTVLVVDDDAGVRDATRLWFELHGAHVLTAAGAAEALVLCLAENRAPSLVVCDFALGAGATGVQLLTELRARAGPVPAIIATGDAAGLRARGVADALTRIVPKPVAAERLLEVGVELMSGGASP